MNLHFHYDVLTPDEQTAVDYAYARMTDALQLHGLTIPGDDNAERVIDGIARGVLTTAKPFKIVNNRGKVGLAFDDEIPGTGGEIVRECATVEEAVELMTLRKRLTRRAQSFAHTPISS